MPSAPIIRRFQGLNNVSDPLRPKLGWLSSADNVDVTNAGGLMRRAGYTKTLAGSFSGAYATLDQARMYMADAGSIKAMAGSAAPVALASGLSTAPMYFTEINGNVHFTNGVDSGIVEPDNRVLPWSWTVPDAPVLAAVAGSLDAGLYQVRCVYELADGRLTGPGPSSEIVLAAGQGLQIAGIPQLANTTTRVYIAPANSTVYALAARRAPAAMAWNASPNALGVELQRPFCLPLPAGCSVIQAWGGRMYAAQYLASADQTIVWRSEPLAFHLFNLEENFFMVPGKVLMLAPQDKALIVGTDRAISAYDGKGLDQLAPYGVVPGAHWSEDDDKRIIFWSTRGACAALPFTNLTQEQVSVAPGVHAGGAIVRSGGQRRYVVALQQGGTAFNKRN